MFKYSEKLIRIGLITSIIGLAILAFSNIVLYFLDGKEIYIIPFYMTLLGIFCIIMYFVKKKR